VSQTGFGERPLIQTNEGVVQVLQQIVGASGDNDGILMNCSLR